MPPSGVLVPTSQLDASPYAREFWDHYMATAPYGMLKPLDVPLIERLCLALSMARDAQEKIGQTGLVMWTGTKRDEKGNLISPGVPIQNPYLAIVNRQSEIARKIAAELGLPVVARARIDMPTDPMPVSERVTQRTAPQTFDGYISDNPQFRPN